VNENFVGPLTKGAVRRQKLPANFMGPMNFNQRRGSPPSAAKAVKRKAKRAAKRAIMAVEGAGGFFG